MKLHRRDYEDYDDLPKWQQVKIDKAIEKRLRKAEERRGNSPTAVPPEASTQQEEKAA